MHNMNIERGRHIFAARAQGIAQGNAKEVEIAQTILAPEILARDDDGRALRYQDVRELSDFAATEHLSAVLDEKLGSGGKWDVKFCTDRAFRQIWKLRQIIDHTGVSYRSYVTHGVRYLKERKQERIHMTMLGRKDVVAHVLAMIADPSSATN